MVTPCSRKCEHLETNRNIENLSKETEDIEMDQIAILELKSTVHWISLIADWR